MKIQLRVEILLKTFPIAALKTCKNVVKSRRKKFQFHSPFQRSIFLKESLKISFSTLTSRKSITAEEKKTKKKGRKKTRFKALFKFLKQIFLCCTMRVKWCWLNEWVLQFFLLSLKNSQPQRNLIVGEKKLFSALSPTNTTKDDEKWKNSHRIPLSAQYTLKKPPLKFSGEGRMRRSDEVSPSILRRKIQSENCE